jgi:membrane-associated phospholipid phosphatase
VTSRILAFLRRHAWSVSLSGLSALSFVSLAEELREDELGAFDAAVTLWFIELRGRFDGLMLFLTHSGGAWGMTFLCTACVLLLASVGSRREARFLAACGIGAFFLSSGLKLLFARARPDPSALYLIDVPGSFSFPSGHALGSTCVVGGLAVVGVALVRRFRWRAAVGVPALVYVLGVAASRVYFGVHFPSDVIGGMLAGSAWVAAMTGWFYPRLLPGEASGEVS